MRVSERFQKQIIDAYSGDFQSGSFASEIPSFENRIVAVSDFLAEGAFATLLSAIDSQARHERVHIPVHKRGATISYHELHYCAPEVIAFYHSPNLHNWCSSVVGGRVMPTPLGDLSSCSILIYDKPFDRIGWHYDLNFYRGRHFTMLLALVNTGRAETGLSSANLMIRCRSGDAIVPTPPNTLILFEGACVYHRVTALKDGERRVVISMTFCTDRSATSLQNIERRFKDIAYFGIRALWA